MKRYGMALFGLILAAIGTLSPLSVGPAGGMLIFTAALAMVTLWRGKDEGAARVRKRAFWASFAISVMLIGLHAGINSAPAQLSETWASWISALSIAAVTVVLVISIHFLLFARKNKPKDRKSWGWRAGRLFLLWIPPVVWLGMIAVNYLLVVMVIYQMTLAAFSLPVANMMESLAQEKDLTSLITVEDGVATVRAGTPEVTYSWICDTPSEIVMEGMPYAANETDKRILVEFCERNG